MATFVQDLTVAAAAGKLAQAMHEAEVDAFGRILKDWRVLSPSERADYVDAAVLYLEGRRCEVIPFPRAI